MKTSEPTAAIVKQLLELIKKMPQGSWTNTMQLVELAAYNCPPTEEEELLEIHRALFEAAEEEEIFLDMSSHEGLFEGLPYVLNYQIFFGEKTWWCCGVSIKGADRVYSYLSDTGYIGEDSFVEVPFGGNDRPRIGMVAYCRPRRAATAPYPVEKMKHILRMATQEEYDAQGALEPVRPQRAEEAEENEVFPVALEDLLCEEDWPAVFNWALAHERSEDPAVQEKVLEAYRAASDGGFPPATVNLAQLYYTGRIVEQDYKEAFRLNKIAADAGEIRGICNCGYSFYYGRHQKPDYTEAGMYFSLGALLYNDANCLYKLGDLFLDGKGVMKNEKYAFLLYDRALVRCQESEEDAYSTADAAVRVGRCMLRGIGTEQNVEQAHALLNFALMNFYKRRRDDPYVAGLIENAKKLIAEAQEILDREIAAAGR